MILGKRTNHAVKTFWNHLQTDILAQKIRHNIEFVLWAKRRLRPCAPTIDRTNGHKWEDLSIDRRADLVVVRAVTEVTGVADLVVVKVEELELRTGPLPNDDCR